MVAIVRVRLLFVIGTAVAPVVERMGAVIIGTVALVTLAASLGTVWHEVFDELVDGDLVVTLEYGFVY